MGGSSRSPAQPGRVKPQRDGERKCLTPGVRYAISLASPNTLTVTLRFPFGIADWASGISAVTGGTKLQRYEQMYGERSRIDDLIHDQLEPVGADCFRVIEALTPGFAIAAAEWNEALAGHPFTMTDWVELTFGEQRSYAARAYAARAHSPTPPPPDPQVPDDRSRDDKETKPQGQQP